MRTPHLAGRTLAALALTTCATALTGCGSAAPARTTATPATPPIAAPIAAAKPTAPATTPTSAPTTAPAATTTGQPAAPGASGSRTPASAPTPPNAAPHDPAAIPVTAPQVPATVWLDPAQLPAGTTLTWSPGAAPTSTSDARLLPQDLWAPWCGGLTGFTTRQQASFTTGPITATQYMFTFPDTPHAQAATQKVLAGRDACAQGWRSMQPDSVMTKTTDTADGSAWSWHWTGLATPATTAGAQQDREYLIQRGPLLAVLEVAEPLASYNTPPRIPATTDPTVLTALATHLCAANKNAC